MTLSQKKLFIYAGVGLVASGVVTVFLIYQGLVTGTEANSVIINDDGRFQMDEIHASSNLAMHIHSRIVLLKDGEQLQVPKEIGISPDFWKDHSLDALGPSSGLIAPLHTHDTSGTIHIESTIEREFILGDFLRIWGVDNSIISRVTDAGGKEIQDYENHVLRANEQLVLEITD
ncbi:MAG: hypothetical protein MN733_20400 [Nitrososphaera sp.]|nr:hypothetical protein [Nitrososphaera sp.]